MKYIIASTLALLWTIVAAPHANGATNETDPHAIVRGMTISCPGAGRIWGTDATVEAFEELKTLGCNWVTIHPYAGIGSDGTVGGRMNRLYDDPTWLTRPIAEAHRLGLKIMIKPHIAYWGSQFRWRGEITFETDAQWQRFFETYQLWITTVAEITADADAFAVGTELEGTTQHEQQWRDIIAAVRIKTNAPLTYCANWDRYEKISFWDAVDVIGIQGYFPLVNHDRVPEPEELDRAWTNLIDRLERYSETHNKKIVLSELGYNNSANAARQPWDYRTGGPDAELVQQRCLKAALDAIDDSDTVVGAFLWKWFPGEPNRGNFLMYTPAMRQTIAAAWAGKNAESSTR